MPPRSATTSRRSRGAAVFRPHPQRRHLDLHYGNGTASLAATRPWIHALSIYGNDYWENKPFRDVTIRRHTDGANQLSIPLVPTGLSDRDMMLEILTSALP